jgi:hypothetical protein
LALRATISPATGAFTSVRLSIRSTFSSRASARASWAFADSRPCVATRTRALPRWHWPRCRVPACLRGSAAFAQLRRAVDHAFRFGGGGFGLDLLRLALRDGGARGSQRGDGLGLLQFSVDFGQDGQHLAFGHHVADIDQQPVQRLTFDQGRDLHLFDRGDQPRGDDPVGQVAGRDIATR